MKRTKKISTTLVLILGAVLIALNLLAIVCMSIVVGRGMNRKQNEMLQTSTADAKKQTEQFVEKYIDVTELLAKSTQAVETLGQKAGQALTEKESFEELTQLLLETMEQYPDILGIGFGSIEENRIYNQEGKMQDALLNERSYFSAAVEGTYVTQPYQDTATGEMCVSVTAPVSDGTGTEGILIVDLRLTQISEFLEQMAFGESGHIMLLSEDNTIMGYDDHAMIGKNIEELEMKGQLAAGLQQPDGSVISYVLNGTSCMGVVDELSGGGWKVLSIISRSEYDAETIKTIVLLAAFLLGTTVVVTVILRTVITKKLQPVTEIKEGLKAMSNGNLHISLEYHGRDEIGEIADSMQSCAKTLSSYVEEIDRVMERLAQGDLTARTQVEFEGDFFPIQRAVSEFVEKLSSLMGSIYHASDQVSSGSSQVAGGAQALAQGATEQASSVQELAAAVTEISETVKDNHVMVMNAASGALQVNSDIVEGGRKMQQSLAFMTEIRDRANEINHIIKTIEDIAFQTNILALNAAVEAARAGSAGKGFAVVADEVRNLAGKTAEASTTTTALIASSLTAVERGTQSMETTSQFMQNVVEEAQKITDVFQTIADASEKQSSSIERVTQGISQISSVVQTNSATAEQSAAVSQEMSGQAQMLRNMISQFNIDDTDRMNAQSDGYGQEI